MVSDRKEWLTTGMLERKTRRLMGMPEIYLYGKETKTVSYTEFVNKELILFSNTDNERSIPSMIDGQLFFLLYVIVTSTLSSLSYSMSYYTKALGKLLKNIYRVRNRLVHCRNIRSLYNICLVKSFRESLVGYRKSYCKCLS